MHSRAPLFFVVASAATAHGRCGQASKLVVWGTVVSTCNRQIMDTGFAFGDQVGMCTVYSYSYTGDKGLDFGSDSGLARGRVTGFQGL